MGAKTIGVLLHQTDTEFSTSNYLLRALLPLWQRMGFQVRVYRGLDRAGPADLLFPHVDLTVLPEPYRRLSGQYARTVNRAIVDISKSGFSGNLLGRGDAYNGPVIVKTDRNFGGIPERRLDRLTRLADAGKTPAPPRQGAGSRRDWSTIRFIDTHNYPVFASLAQVPPAVFDNPDLIVEKFLPERDGEYFCLRYCYFVGDREASVLLRSRHRVVKASNSLSCEPVATPPDCRALRERMGFEFGKFDYVMRDGKAVLFDISRTPAIETLQTHKLARRIIPMLAEGIHAMTTAG
jgi:hypothetical protein